VLTRERHLPVLADRVTELLRPRPGAVLVDATLGLGGHAERLLDAGATVVGLDRDPHALAAAGERLAGAGERLRTVRASFADLAAAAAEAGVDQVDGVLYDLGVSSMQLDEAGRGFSYRHEAPLDMRMDPDGPVSAADVVNDYPVEELARVLREWGEERFAGRIARAIGDARRTGVIRTTVELAELVKQAIPAAARRRGPHPARRTFQALRIEVNGELAALEASLPQAVELLAPGGRLVVLSYHSLEDRITKRFLAAESGRAPAPGLPGLPPPGQPEPRLVLLTRRPETPAPAEVKANPRAESAKLRAAERRPAETQARPDPSNRSEAEGR
jgi:16S rRNA (cytosine1402-N4)-methyltransferase